MDVEKVVALLAAHRRRVLSGSWNMIHSLKQMQYSFFFFKHCEKISDLD